MKLNGRTKRHQRRRSNSRSAAVYAAVLLVGATVTVLVTVFAVALVFALTEGMSPLVQLPLVLSALTVGVVLPVFLVGSSPPLAEVRR